MGKRGSTYQAAQLNAKARQREFVAAYGRPDVPTVKEALGRVRLSRTTYHGWLGSSQSFRNAVELVKLEKKAQRAAEKNAEASDLVLDEDRVFVDVPPVRDFRWEYFGFPTPQHQDPIFQAYEDKTNLRIVVLGPPGSGKDSASRDMVAHAVVDERTTRVAWIMKNEKFSKRRISQRLDPYLSDRAVYRTAPLGPGTQIPTASLIDDFGPFKWATGMRWRDGSKVEKTTWNTSEIYFIRRGAVEADPNLWATGIDGQLYGARVDLMVVSDPFDAEDSRSPTTRQTKLDWFMGTARSRLDERGRLIVLGTRVPGDAYEDLLELYVGNSRVVKEDGYYTKYANGTATVIFPAIQHDAAGEEVSYWPERFPLHGRIEYLDGDDLVLTPEVVDSLTDRELEDLTDVPGAERVQGLYEIRESTPSLFKTMYQQEPDVESGGEFTDLILDHCDDPSRSFGMVKPGEQLLHGVDPARTGGAAWWLWAVDFEKDTAALVDYFFGEKLGVIGIKNQLIMEPLRKYLPRWMAYETNHESAVLELEEIQAEVRRTTTEIVRHRTDHYNRNVGDVSVASMVFDMRDGKIRFPAATAEDRERLRLVKEQFRAWDRREAAKAAGVARWKSLGADDVAMAAWVGWVHWKGLSRKKGRKLRSVVRRIPDVTLKRWAPRIRQSEKRLESVRDGGGPPVTDLLGAWFGDD